MGNNQSQSTFYHPPRVIEGSTIMNDPLFGFSEGRKERPLPKATLEEMEAAGLAKWQRDYCADYTIAMLDCRRQKFPWILACRDQRHDLEHCQLADYQLRVNEAERERRLLMRERRKAGLPEEEHPYLDKFQRQLKKLWGQR